MSLPPLPLIRDRLGNLAERDDLDLIDAEIAKLNDAMRVLRARYSNAVKKYNAALDRECDKLDAEYPGWRDVLFNTSIGKL